jgi:hypothetical protein
VTSTTTSTAKVAAPAATSIAENTALVVGRCRGGGPAGDRIGARTGCRQRFVAGFDGRGPDATDDIRREFPDGAHPDDDAGADHHDDTATDAHRH